jgi:hypothetical protein
VDLIFHKDVDTLAEENTSFKEQIVSSDVKDANSSLLSYKCTSGNKRIGIESVTRNASRESKFSSKVRI